MGLWAGPGWPEAGLGTKPPGSPYLGRGRWAAPRGSPRRPGPATPSPRGPSPGLGATAGPLPAREQRPFGTMDPLPRLRAKRYKGRGARPGNEPGVRKVKTKEKQGKGEDGGGRGSPAGRSSPPSKALPSAPPRRQRRERRPAAHSTPAEREEGSAHKEEWNPRPPLAPGAGMTQSALAADGQRRLPGPRPSRAGVRAGRPSPGLTHSSVPQLMAELEATRGVWPLRCPSVCRICP